MTSTFESIEPQLPTGARGLPLHQSQIFSHTFQQPPRPRPRQTSTTKPNAPATVNCLDLSEPPFKKPKLADTTIPQIRSEIAGGAPRSPNPEHPGSREPAPVNKQDEEKSRVHQYPLFPFRPGGQQSRSGVKQVRPIAIERAARKDGVPVQAYVPEPPTCAPRYHGAGPADFFPWGGHHPEDVLNEHTTKQGFYDKVPTSYSETGTARPSLWSSLKHKSGLQILSSLFVSALDQRQAHCTITANSTFKPPPRVTLTDAKREAWLRDLADPVISLRRLSRTIPHGIRGRALLDHCLNKDIPISRAIWLAKCVGANEIRAFKRKGAGGVFTVGGEAKWIKDWTANIEQFLESIIGSCGSHGWKPKVTYGLRLMSHLFWENLLDRGHYLDWLIESIESSDLESLPLWLLVQQVHQREILQHGRRGRRLASAILEHLHNAKLSVESEVYDSVSLQLIRSLRFMMVFAPACFLLSRSWSRHEEALKICIIHQEDIQLQTRFESLARRNEALQNLASKQNKRLQYFPSHRIISLLDRLYNKPNYNKVAVSCLRITDDKIMLVNICIAWSSTIYRHGSFRTFAAARLIRIWSRHGIELQQALIDFLTAETIYEDLSKKDVYRLYAALVASRHFSVGRYLQWLMARGTLYGQTNCGPDCPCDVGLLLELPLHGLSSHVLNLRQTLVSSTVKTLLEEESRLIAGTKAQVSHQVPDFFESIEYPVEIFSETSNIMHLSQTVKSSVARWIRQNIIRRLPDEDLGTDFEKDGKLKNPSSGTFDIISLDQFLSIRRLLEDFEDFNILADVLNLIADQVNGSVLIAVTDTINFYFDIFYAIGATDRLFRRLYSHVEADQKLELENGFLESLLDLSHRLPQADEEIQRLREEISAHIPRFPAAACSPISDTMVEAAQSTEPSFINEMDQMLASGISMDKQTLSRIFAVLICHLEKSFTESDHFAVRFSQLLAKLRGFDPEVFDVLLSEWLGDWLQRTSPRSLLKSLVPMICSKVIPIGIALRAIVRILDAGSEGDHKANVALDSLRFISGLCRGNVTNIDYRAYRLRDQLQDTIQTDPRPVLVIMQRVFGMCRATESSIRSKAEKEIASDSVRELAQSVLLWHFETNVESASTVNNSSVGLETQDALGTILYPSELGESALPDLRDQIMNILDHVSGFNITSFRFKIRAIFASAAGSPSTSTNNLSKAIIKRAITSPRDRVDLWTFLIPALSSSQISSLRDLAEGEVLAWATGDLDATLNRQATQIESLVPIVEASAFSVPFADTSAQVERIVGFLTSHFHHLQPNEDSSCLQLETGLVFQRIDVFLRLLVLYQPTIQHPKYPQQILYQLFLALSLLLIHPLLTSQSTLPQRIFDVLSLLTDHIADDTRSRCIHSLRDEHCTRDPRLRFVFGYSDTIEGEWLQRVTKSTPVAEMKSGSEGTVTGRPYPLRKWEMMQDATPVVMENDTSLSLTLFGSRKSVL